MALSLPHGIVVSSFINPGPEFKANIFQIPILSNRYQDVSVANNNVSIGFIRVFNYLRTVPHSLVMPWRGQGADAECELIPLDGPMS